MRGWKISHILTAEGSVEKVPKAVVARSDVLGVMKQSPLAVYT
jgi:hypothetical protein